MTKFGKNARKVSLRFGCRLLSTHKNDKKGRLKRVTCQVEEVFNEPMRIQWSVSIQIRLSNTCAAIFVSFNVSPYSTDTRQFHMVRAFVLVIKWNLR